MSEEKRTPSAGPAGDPVRVLIADSDGQALAHLSSVLEGSEDFLVVGLARNGQQALQLASGRAPRIILMAVDQTPLDGLEATRRIMAEAPVPIVVYPSGSSPRAPGTVARAFEALRVGAVAVAEPPFLSPTSQAKLLRTLKAMAQVQVVTLKRPGRLRAKAEKSEEISNLDETRRRVEIIAMGASTGGPLALKRVLSRLPDYYSVPIMVVQHIAPGFLDSMVRWLKDESSLSVGIASDGEMAVGGRVYFAPDAYHMGVTSEGKIILDSSGPIAGVRPSVSFLFGSVAEAYPGRSAGVLLSGMGGDGSIALEAMRRAGAVTVAQDEESSVVFGMARKAIELDGVEHILSPEEIGDLLSRLGAPEPPGDQRSP